MCEISKKKNEYNKYKINTAEVVGEAAPAVIATIIFTVLGPAVAVWMPETCLYVYAYKHH